MNSSNIYNVIRFLLLILFVHNCHGYDILQYFKAKETVFCGRTYNDLFQEEIANSFQAGEKWIRNWNCLDKEIPSIVNGLIVLEDIKPQEFLRLLAQPNIQNSLSSNVWIVIGRTSVEEYFNQRNLKIGLNAQILYLDFQSGGGIVTQILGTATFQVKRMVRFANQ